MSDHVDRLCGESEEVAALLRGKSAEDLRAALHNMARCWRFTPGDLELALREAAQCRHWRKADAAWARYEELLERSKALEATGPEHLPERVALFAARTRAFSEYQRHDEAANKLWDAPPRAD